MTSRDVLRDLLRRQHARIRTLIGDLLHQTGPPKRLALERLTTYVALHEAAERVFLRSRGSRLDDEVAVMQARFFEEREVDVHFARLERMPLDSVDFMIEVGLLEEALQSHLPTQEAEVAVLSQHARSGELEHLVGAMGLVDELAGVPLPGRSPASSYAEQREHAAGALLARSG